MTNNWGVFCIYDVYNFPKDIQRDGENLVALGKYPVSLIVQSYTMEHHEFLSTQVIYFLLLFTD